MSISYINTIESYSKSIANLTNCPEIALDIETYVLPQYKGLFNKAFNPHNCGISTIQVKAKDSNVVYIFDIIELENLSYNPNVLKDLILQKEYVVIHNASFEAKFLKKYWGCWLPNLWCTRVASQLISNAFSSKYIRSSSGHSLDMLCKDYLDIDIIGKGTTQIEDWIIRPLSEEKLKYAATDVLYLSRLKELFEEVICTPCPKAEAYNIGDPWGLGMSEILKLEMDFITVEAECEYNGLPINELATKTYEEVLGEPLDSKKKVNCRDDCEVSRVAGELCTKINLATKQSLDLNVLYPIPTTDALKTLKSPTKLLPLINQYIGKASSSQGQVVRRILALLEQIKDTGSPDYYSEEEEVDYKELEHLIESEVVHRSSVAKLLINFKMLNKQAGMKLSKKIHSITKRIHYSLNSLGASTGRCSSSNPNSQNINAKVEIPITLTKENYLSYFNSNSVPIENL